MLSKAICVLLGLIIIPYCGDKRWVNKTQYLTLLRQLVVHVKLTTLKRHGWLESYININDNDERMKTDLLISVTGSEKKPKTRAPGTVAIDYQCYSMYHSGKIPTGHKLQGLSQVSLVNYVTLNTRQLAQGSTYQTRKKTIRTRAQGIVACVIGQLNDVEYINWLKKAHTK